MDRNKSAVDTRGQQIQKSPQAYFKMAREASKVEARRQILAEKSRQGRYASGQK